MKMKIFAASLLGVAALAWTSSPAMAVWVELDDFDSYDNTDTHTTVATGGVWTSVWDGTGNSHVIDSDQGQSLQALGGAPWRGAERDITGTGAAVIVGEIKTFFWQVKASGTSGGYDFMMGLSPSVSNIDTNLAYQDFNVMPFVNNGVATPFINAQAPTTPWWAPMDPGVWHNVWVVINNNATDPTYDLYYSKGTDPATLVAADADWRNTGQSGMGINQTLNAIGFMAAGDASTELLIDNIYYAAGSDTSNPLAAVPEPSAFLFGGLVCSVLGVNYVRKRRSGSADTQE